MTLTRKIEIELKGDTERDLEKAFEEALRRIKDGNLVGSDSTETGSFSFASGNEGAEADVFQSVAELSSFLFRITDNGGATFDRYTVTFSDGSYLGLSGSPSHPQGFSQWGEDIDPRVQHERVEEGVEVDLAIGDLPEGLQRHILFRCNEGLEDFLSDVQALRLKAVATDRDSAEENDGNTKCTGVGIYRGSDGLMVKLDGYPSDDRGPFASAREAVLATLPDEYSFSGPEYHSSLDVMRETTDPAVAAAVADLVAKVIAEDSPTL